MNAVEKYKSYLTEGLASNLVEGGVAIVYYYEANTILCIKENLTVTINDVHDNCWSMLSFLSANLANFQLSTLGCRVPMSASKL